MTACEYEESSPLIISNKPIHQAEGETKNTPVESIPKGNARNKALKLSSLSKRKKLIMGLCALAFFFSGCGFALIAPFFPQVAERKGMSLTTVGLVFSVFQLVISATAPIVGNYITRIGVKFVMLSGIFVAGTCKMLFGTLIYCPNGMSFIVMCILCRCIEAMGFASFTTSVLTIVSTEYPDHIGSVFATLQGGNTFGMMLGPVVGGVLYDWGGFGLPFFLTGSLILMNGFVIYMLLPQPESVLHKREKSLFRLLTCPRAMALILSVFTGVACLTVLDSTFVKHVTPFHLSAAAIGALYVIGPGSYSFASPLWGYIVDVRDVQIPLILCGHLSFAMGFMIMGVSPWLSFIPYELLPIGIGFFIIGSTFGCLNIPAIKSLVKTAHEMKYEKNIDTNAMVAGLVNSVIACGGFVGPLMGAAVVDRWGSRMGYTIFAMISIGVLALVGTFHTFEYWKRRRGAMNQSNESDKQETVLFIC